MSQGAAEAKEISTYIALRKTEENAPKCNCTLNLGGTFWTSQ